ncbi:porin family protein [Hymenobacter sp. BT770]|uniref:porin family protein n=1 Tax=Hymenobacter sp. BT770 TaxID=2886942 RepID=UPI001D1232A1|nr:porin family protein [Hymenobacter sp. BT770]MCC3154233.1 porin family protein [Hymenobacter sp. BT770]MDO3416387.1 porin family protein [Hymenobacter sp. BT770]
MRFLLGALVLTGNLGSRCRAQDAPVPAQSAVALPAQPSTQKTKWQHQYRYYVGAQAAAQLYRVVNTGYSVQEAIVKPLYVFAGYQLTPHLAVQAGFLRRTYLESSINASYTNQANQPVTYIGRTEMFDSAVPIFLRFRLARQPTHRLYIDALLGPTLLFHRYKSDVIYTVGGQVQNDVHFDLPTQHLYVTGGLSAGFRIIPRLDIMVEGTAIRGVEKGSSDGSKPFTFGIGAGLCYRFDGFKMPS